MAGQPSSSHREREHGDRAERHGHRSERSSHHHHRTISSTTLLLVLSLILAVLAVMLSLPSQNNTNTAAAATNAANTAAQAAQAADPAATGVWGYLTPKRSQALVAREGQVAMRESEVARREAELLAGAPGGVIPPSAAPILCPICPSVVETVHAPIQTIIKEVVKETDVAPAGWAGVRAEEILDRELRIAEREREIGKREDNVNRREHDASRREGWIMEQLIVLGNGDPQTVQDDEWVYEPAAKQRRAKVPYIAETIYEPEVQTVTETLPPRTVTVPAPANTRLAARPTPDVPSHSATASTPRTTSVEIITEEDIVDEDGPKTLVRRNGGRPPNPNRRPEGWFGGW